MTTEPTDTAADKITDTRRPFPWARAAAVAPTGLVGTASFIESFHGLYDLMERVEHADVFLAAVGPIGVDGLQLVSLAGTVITRRANWRVRLYMWTAFAGANAVSVAGNLVDAAARHLTDAGIAIAGAWPVLLAAASHIVVVSLRQLERRGGEPAPEPTPVPPVEVLEGRQDEEHTDVGDEEDRPSVPTDAQLRARARQRYGRGVSCRQIAIDLRAQGYDVSEKKVERWTADMRNGRRAAATDGESVPEPATT